MSAVDYDVEAASPDRPLHQQRYAAESAEISILGDDIDLSYGPDPAERLDIHWPEGKPRAALMFFHGGYWRGGAKEPRRFILKGFRGEGIAYVNIEYPLAPVASLTAIVESARRAVAFAEARVARRMGSVPIILSGNSAGAHLALMASDRVANLAALVAISGLYDLRPLTSRPQGEAVGLTDPMAEALSPRLLGLARTRPILFTVGGNEPAAFVDQTIGYFRERLGGGTADALHVLAGHDHFSILGDFGRPGTLLTQATLSLV